MERKRPRIPSDHDLVDTLSGLGPKSRKLLGRLGIETVAELREVGAVEAYRRAKELEETVSLNLLWALESALTGKDWREVARDDRERLLRELGA